MTLIKVKKDDGTWQPINAAPGPAGPPGPQGPAGPTSAPNPLLLSGYLWWRSKYYYDQRLGTSNVNSALAMTANALVLTPLVLPQDVSFDRIAVYVSTASGSAGSTGRLGIYSSDATGAPTTPLLDAGTFLTDAVGLIQTTISLTLPAGLYYTACWIGAVAWTGAALAAGAQRASFGMFSPAANTNPGTSVFNNAPSLTAFPNFSAGWSGGVGQTPAVWLRVV